MREAARVQSFPDFFSFKTTGIVEGYAMIGNAVPPLLANTFANRLAELDERYNFFSRPIDSLLGKARLQRQAASPFGNALVLRGQNLYAQGLAGVIDAGPLQLQIEEGRVARGARPS
jgi:hypothetical protein